MWIMYVDMGWMWKWGVIWIWVVADVCGYGVVSGYGVATVSRIDQFKVSFGHEPLHKGSFAQKSLRLIESTDRSQFYKGFCMWRI